MAGDGSCRNDPMVLLFSALGLLAVVVVYDLLQRVRPKRARYCLTRAA